MASRLIALVALAHEAAHHLIEQAVERLHKQVDAGHAKLRIQLQAAHGLKLRLLAPCIEGLGTGVLPNVAENCLTQAFNCWLNRVYDVWRLNLKQIHPWRDEEVCPVRRNAELLNRLLAFGLEHRPSLKRHVNLAVFQTHQRLKCVVHVRAKATNAVVKTIGADPACEESECLMHRFVGALLVAQEILRFGVSDGESAFHKSHQ